MPRATRTANCTACSRAASWGKRRLGSCGRRWGSTKVSRGCGRPSWPLLHHARKPSGLLAVFLLWLELTPLPRSLSHAQTLLGLIQSFPATNPTPVPDAPLDNDTPELRAAREAAAAAAPDLPAMLSAIRARYRLLCTSVGVRPRLVTAAKDGTDGASESAGVVEGIEGPMKGVDTRQLRF